jgi:hypothetical protein
VSKLREPYSVKMLVVLKSICRRWLSEYGIALSVKDEVSKDRPNERYSIGWCR